MLRMIMRIWLIPKSEKDEVGGVEDEKDGGGGQF